MLIGAVDRPGGLRYKSPYPKPIPPAPKPGGKKRTRRDAARRRAARLPQRAGGFAGREAGEPLRIDSAYSWEAPLAAHGLMHIVIGKAGRGDRTAIDTLFLYMANMGWN